MTEAEFAKDTIAATRCTGAAVGSVRAVLRFEGLCVLATACLAYAKFGQGWGVFFACFLLPDLSFLGYAVGRRAGAALYNAAHSYAGAVASLAAAVAFPAQVPLAVGLIWCAHIGFDRALGYGLKYGDGFNHTHLGRIGRPPPAPADLEPGPAARASGT
jgi:hypothetical protein